MEKLEKGQNSENNNSDINGFTNDFKIIIKLGEEEEKISNNNNKKILNNNFNNNKNLLIYPKFKNNNNNISEIIKDSKFIHYII